MISQKNLSPHIDDKSVENTTPPEDLEKTYIPIIIICLVICVLGIIGNGVLIYLLSFRIDKTQFTIYVLNLSIADVLLLFNYFIDHASFFRPIQPPSFISPLGYILYLSGNDATIYFLTIMTVERYFMVIFSVWYHFHRPKLFTAFMCTILWVLSLVMTGLEYFSCNPKYFFSRIFNCDIVISIHFICNFMSIIAVVVFFIVAFFTKIQRQSQRDFPTTFDISIKAIMIWTLVFWLPIRIVDFLYLWVPHEYLPDHFGVSLISESIYSSGRPYLYLLVGWWKNQELERSIHIFIENSLNHTEENMSTATEEDVEQA